MVPRLIARLPFIAPFAALRVVCEHNRPAGPAAGAPRVLTAITVTPRTRVLDRRRSDHSHHFFFYTCVVSLIMWIVLAFAVDKLHGQTAAPHGFPAEVTCVGPFPPGVTAFRADFPFNQLSSPPLSIDCRFELALSVSVTALAPWLLP